MLSGQIKRTNTILYCKQWASTLGFYRDRLGLPVHHETEWMVEFRLNDNAFLSVADETRATIRSGGHGVTLSWRVTDLDRLHRQLKDLGVEPGRIEKVWGARAFIFFDPEGHRLEMWE